MLLKSPLANLSRTIITLEDRGWPTKMEETTSSERADTRADPESQVTGGILESCKDIKNL